VMVNPRAVGGGDHTVFVSGNDLDAKAQVTKLLKSFGWSDVLDLGDVASARGPEMCMAMWIRLWGATKTGMLNVKVVR
jgi:predicted dinucleotide-binding enzyme